MQGYNDGIGNYQRMRIVTADPGKLVLLCYEEAISHLRMARDCALAKDQEGKAKAMQKALDFLHELMQSLDFEKGGEIARNLGALYSYMVRRLLDGDIRQDLTAFDEVIGLLEEIEGAWKAICSGAPNTAAPSPPAQAGGEPRKTPAAMSAWRA